MIHVVERLVQKMKSNEKMEKIVDKPAKKPSAGNGRAQNEINAIKREFFSYFGSGCDDGKARESMPLLFIITLFYYK